MSHKLYCCIFFITLVMACSSTRLTTAPAGKAINWKQVHVLVYTKNGKGYVHDNIASGTASIKQLGAQHGFSVDASDNPADFNDDNLKKYNALIFNNTNNGVFDTDEQIFHTDFCRCAGH